MHVWPVAAKTPAMIPLAAAGRSASSKTICGDLPPSSRVTRLTLSAAACATARPVAVEPVNADLVHALVPGQRGAELAAGARDHVEHARREPGLVQHLREGRASTRGSAPEGFTTNVQPAARPGASLNVMSSSGEFHGVIAPTTPTGSRRVKQK
jgi:hypothetical protein